MPPSPNATPDNGNNPPPVSWKERFCLFICLVSSLCALGIFTESQFYAYTIGIHGTYAHIIYFAVGVTLFSAIQVLLIQPNCCRAFLDVYNGCFILKTFGGFLVMFTICFLSSGTGLRYLRLSSDGTAPKPAVAVALAPYRSQAFAEIAGLLASALLTVNAVSIIHLLTRDKHNTTPDKHNTIFEVAATLTLGSAIDLLYKYPYVTVAAAVFITLAAAVTVSDQLLPGRVKHNPVLNTTMPPSPNAPPDNDNNPPPVSWKDRFYLFICLVSFLCALGIFTESQFYAYTIGIHGTYAHIIYFAVGVTLFSAIQVLLIQPHCCRAFLDVYNGCFILKTFGGLLVMFTICFLSSGTGLRYLRLSSDGTAPKPAVAVALAPYRSQAFAEIAGLLASALLTVNALSIILLLTRDKHNTTPDKHNTSFEVAATLTLGSAIDLLYKYPYVTVAAAVFIMAMTLLKNYLHRDQVVNDPPNR